MDAVEQAKKEWEEACKARSKINKRMMAMIAIVCILFAVTLVYPVGWYWSVILFFPIGWYMGRLSKQSSKAMEHELYMADRLMDAEFRNHDLKKPKTVEPFHRVGEDGDGF